jgi:DNA-binding Lrp family transcriptional regulator
VAAGSSGSLETLRRLNRLRVVNTLRENGVISRAEIARRTGLSRSTVSSLVADLQADGFVIERAEPGAAYGVRGGRPPILLAFDASAGAAVGIAFGHVGVRVAVSDLSSTILAEGAVELDVDHEATEGLDAAAELVTGALAEAGVGRERVIGAGVALPAPIHRATGIAAQPARAAGARRERREPRRARRGGLRGGSRGGRPGVPDGLLERRSGAGAQRAPVSGQPRLGW